MKSESEFPLSVAESRQSGALDWVVSGGMVDEVFQRVEARMRRRHRRRVISGGATLVAVCLATLLWVVPYIRETSTILTLPAHRQSIALADGSRAELNARTSLQTDFRYGRRVVRLKSGEAFFSIAKDRTHPFLVETSAGTVRVTGTKFNVRLVGDGHVEVTLLEGSVQVKNAAADPLKISPGQQIYFINNGANLRTLSASDLESAVAWRDGLIVLNGLTLAEAAKRLSLYHGREIAVASEVASLRPGGTYALDNLEGFLGAMEAALPIRIIPESDGSYHIIAKAR
jgi:transmembrane sensor